MRGNKTYRKEFISTVKDYNKDLYDSYEEVKSYPKPPIGLIDDIVLALINNYNKFEAFHRQEALLLNMSLDRFESELSKAKVKISQLSNAKGDDNNSYQ